MALAQRASPPEGPGAASGYLWLMDDPPQGLGLRPVSRTGSYGTFSSPSPGDPLLGEAVDYLSSWAARLAAASSFPRGSALPGWPQALWRDAGGGIAWGTGFASVPWTRSPRFDLFRLRALCFQRELRAPLAPPPGDPPPPPAAWTRYAEEPPPFSAEVREEYPGGPVPSQDPAPSWPDPAPSFSSARRVASSAAELEGNGGGWLVPLGSPDAPPFPDSYPDRCVAAYAADASGPQPDASAADGGFMPSAGSPGGVPLRASDVASLFADALASGRSAAWAGTDAVAPFADVEDVEVPAHEETVVVTRCSGTVSYSFASQSDPSQSYSSGTVPFSVDLPDGLPDPGSRFDVSVEGAGGARVYLSYVPVPAGATWSVVVPGKPAASETHASRDLLAFSGGTVRGVGSEASFSLSFSTEETVVEVPASVRRERRPSALSAPCFSFRSVARLAPGSPADVDASGYAGWVRSVTGVSDLSLLYDWPTVLARDPADNRPLDVSDYLAASSGGGLVAPAAGTGVPHSPQAAWSDSVSPVRGTAGPGGWPEAPPGYSLRATSDWCVSASSPADAYGVNYMVPEGGSDADSVASPVGEDGRFDLEFAPEAPADPASGPSPLCPGGVRVPARSADSVAARPLFVADVEASWTVVRTFDAVRSAVGPRDDAPSGYAYSERRTLEIRCSRTLHVVGFAPNACAWTRDAGEGSAPAAPGGPVLGAAGAAGLWDFVVSSVLAPCGLSPAKDMLGTPPASPEWFERAASPGYVPPGMEWFPHDSVVVRWTAVDPATGAYVDGGPAVLQTGAWTPPAGEYVCEASVTGSVSFPLCAFESGYCA